MPAIGKAREEAFSIANQALTHLSETELQEYRAHIAGIAENVKYNLIDETIGDLTATDKLKAIDHVLKTYHKTPVTE